MAIIVNCLLHHYVMYFKSKVIVNVCLNFQWISENYSRRVGDVWERYPITKW